MKGLIASHSGLRYIVLALILVAIFNALANLKSGEYSKKDKMINLFAMISLHIQLLLGLVLYFMSSKVVFGSETMKEATYRFFTVEHALLMLVGIILITLGRKKAESRETPALRHKLILRYYLLGFILIFIGIPWPFLHNVGAGWF